MLPQLSAGRGAAAAVGRSRRPRRRRPRKTKAVGTLVDAAREGRNPTPPPLAEVGPGGGGGESPCGSPPKTNSFRFGPPRGCGWVGDSRSAVATRCVHFRSKRTCGSPSSDYIGTYILSLLYILVLYICIWYCPSTPPTALNAYHPSKLLPPRPST